MSQSNIGNASSDLPPSYDEVCSTAERRGTSPSTSSRKTNSNSKSKNNETVAEFSPTAPPQDILENIQVPEPTRSDDTSIPMNDIIDVTDFDAMSPATRINKRYQQIPQGPGPQNNARWHQRLRRNLSYNGSDDGKYAKYAVFAVGGIFAVFFLIAIFCMPSTSHLNYLQSKEYLKYRKEMDHLFEVNDYLSGRRDMKKDFEELSARFNSTNF